MYNQSIRLAEAYTREVKSSFAPILIAQYGNQKIGNQKGFYKYEVGISVPLIFASQLGKTQAAIIKQRIAEENYLQKTVEVQTDYQNLSDNYQKWLLTWHYYRDDALPMALELKNGAAIAYEQGAIDYVSFLQNIRDAVQMELKAQEAFASYLEARFKLEYFLNSAKQE